LLDSERGMSVAVVRAPTPILARARDRLERWLDLTIPQLERDDRITLFESLQIKSRWNFDFLALMALSTGIASLGLTQNSTAVVIGAMLVAPLMTPLLGAGLALVQDNFPLVCEVPILHHNPSLLSSPHLPRSIAKNRLKRESQVSC